MRTPYSVPEPSPDRRPLTKDELEEAICAQVGDDEIFFAEKGQGYRDAEKVCAGCPIASRCLSSHLEEEFGFWAASPPVRKQLLAELEGWDAAESEGAA